MARSSIFAALQPARMAQGHGRHRHGGRFHRRHHARTSTRTNTRTRTD